jgi:hypothetical protein
MNGVSNGPNVPGGEAIDGATGKPIPLDDELILFDGTDGIQLGKVGGPIMPGFTGNGVAPEPSAGGRPEGAGTPIAWAGAPATKGSYKVVACWANAPWLINGVEIRVRERIGSSRFCNMVGLLEASNN